jgi:hypothetical protein
MGIIHVFEYSNSDKSSVNNSNIWIFDLSNISIRCYNTIRNENYSFKFSRNRKRLIIIGIVASNTDIRMFEYSIIQMFECSNNSIIRLYITSLLISSLLATTTKWILHNTVGKHVYIMLRVWLITRRYTVSTIIW